MGRALGASISRTVTCSSQPPWPSASVRCEQLRAAARACFFTTGPPTHAVPGQGCIGGDWALRIEAQAAGHASAEEHRQRASLLFYIGDEEVRMAAGGMMSARG